MNSENGATSDEHKPLLNLANEISLKRSDTYIAFSNINIYYIWKNIKKFYKNSKVKLSGPTWDE